MSTPNARIAMLTVCLIALLSEGCNRRPPPITMPSVDAAAAASRAIKKYDADGNGQIDAGELDKAPALKCIQERIDLNGDGLISASEIADEIKLWQDSGLGVMTFSCYVNKGDKPLEGATVKFVPEKFLGDNFKTAVGVTDEYGYADIAIPDFLPEGISPGLYRVEITKKGVDIPAMYNTETIFGLEISSQASMLSEDPHFELD